MTCFLDLFLLWPFRDIDKIIAVRVFLVEKISLMRINSSKSPTIGSNIDKWEKSRSMNWRNVQIHFDNVKKLHSNFEDSRVPNLVPSCKSIYENGMKSIHQCILSSASMNPTQIFTIIEMPSSPPLILCNKILWPD